MNRWRQGLRPWWELLRIPNLPTVPGGAVAGYALGLAAWSRVPSANRGLGVCHDHAYGNLPAVATAVTLVYMAGLALNDWADAAIDARERPRRPIPSGRLTRRGVLWAAVVMAAVGVSVSAAAGWACAVVCAAIVLLAVVYDLATVRGAAVGWLLMGACRALTVLAGALAAAGWPALSEPGVLAAGALLGADTVAVSALAAREAESHVPGARRWAPPAVILAGAGCVFWLRLPGWLPCVIVLLVGALSALNVVARLDGLQAPGSVGGPVGALIRGLIPVQAALCLAAGWTDMGLVVMALYPVALVLSRSAPGS